MKTVIIKGFPEDLHREMKNQAALEGITIKDLVIRAIRDCLKKRNKN